ncbi:hypothetical protein JYU19_00505 [bacterium AH-315-J21]|nr:hypothetical protein [bacterium AH-315-J21]
MKTMTAQKEIIVPGYVCGWTDAFFHQSAWVPPVMYPSKKVINYLGRFEKPVCVLLYRGINKYNIDTNLITSWTYEEQVAKRYADLPNGRVIEKEFLSSQILLDTTLLTESVKNQLGYDYKIDDQEVLVLEA